MCLFQLAKPCILDAKFEIVFCKKQQGQMKPLKNPNNEVPHPLLTELIDPCMQDKDLGFHHASRLEPAFQNGLSSSWYNWTPVSCYTLL